MTCQDLIADFTQTQDLLRLDLNVRRLSLCSSKRLMDHNTGMREGIAFSLRTRRQENRAHARRLSNTDRGDIRLDILHGIIDRQSCRDNTAGAVDVKGDILIGIL